MEDRLQQSPTAHEPQRAHANRVRNPPRPGPKPEQTLLINEGKQGSRSVKEKHFKSFSFIKLGPIRRLQQKYGRDSVYVINEHDVGLSGGSPASIDINALKLLLQKPLSDRLTKEPDPSTFDPLRTGHVIKLVVGLIQEYGALEVEEIIDLLKVLNVSRTGADIQRYALCAELVGWLKIVSKGTSDYLVAVANRKDAANIAVKATAAIKNRIRRRADIRTHWQSSDLQRYKAISEVTVGVIS